MDEVVSRKTNGVYMSEEIFKAFTQYATRKNPRRACQVWEDALSSYMVANPVDGVMVRLHQISVALPNRRDKVRMRTVIGKLEIFMELIDKMKLNGGDPSKLRDKLSTWVIRGTEIKNTSEDFITVLEKASNYV